MSKDERRHGPHLRSLSAETSCKLDILRLNGNTLGVNGAEVGVFEEGDEICLDGFLQSADLVLMLAIHSP
jgi:hypothetical protein